MLESCTPNPTFEAVNLLASPASVSLASWFRHATTNLNDAVARGVARRDVVAVARPRSGDTGSGVAGEVYDRPRKLLLQRLRRRHSGECKCDADTGSNGFGLSTFKFKPRLTFGQLQACNDQCFIDTGLPDCIEHFEAGQGGHQQEGQNDSTAELENDEVALEVDEEAEEEVEEQDLSDGASFCDRIRAVCPCEDANDDQVS